MEKLMRSKGSQQTRSKLTCSTCGRRFFLDETSTPPFCSERCQMIDLGRWLDEENGLPHEGGPENGEIVEQQDDEESDDETDYLR
jgi:endogenous inhibitor of DNA gyrase (YacG/DUF329 family)